MRNDLGKFFLKNTYNNPISLGGISDSKLVDFFKKMTLIRKTELKVADLIRKKVIKKQHFKNFSIFELLKYFIK